MWVVKIDSHGLYIPGSDNPEYEGKESATIVATPTPTDKSFWHPRWTGTWNGDSWVGGEWVEGHENPRPITDFNSYPQSVEEAKKYIQQLIIDLAAKKQEALVEGYSPTEQATWDYKEREAVAYLQTGKMDFCKYLRAEAIAMTGASDEIAIADAVGFLANVIVQKADGLRIASSIISGTRARKWNEVEALGNIKEIMSYPVEQGWEHDLL